MNKKLLFLYLSAVALTIPMLVQAQAGTQACIFLKKIETALVSIGATLVIVSWIVAGILYLISIGSQEKMTTAKRAIAAAIIGTILVILSAAAYAIVNSFLGGGGPASTC